MKRKRTQTYTTRTTGAVSYGQFRTKRTSLKAYRRRLWNSTMDSTHWRSVYSVSATIAAQATANTATTNILGALHPDGNVFWLASGGCNPQTSGGAVPTSWADDFVIRGGMISINFTNIAASASPLRITCFLIKTGQDFDTTSFPASVQEGWDPSVYPEFATQIGKIIMKREMVLENEGFAQVGYRLPVRKVNGANESTFRKTYVWCVLTNSPETGADVVRVTYGFNISFTGDVIAVA